VIKNQNTQEQGAICSHICTVSMNYQLFHSAKSVKTEETLEYTLLRENFETTNKIIDSMVVSKHLWTNLWMYLVHQETRSVWMFVLSSQK